MSQRKVACLLKRKSYKISRSFARLRPAFTYISMQYGTLRRFFYNNNVILQSHVSPCFFVEKDSAFLAYSSFPYHAQNEWYTSVSSLPTFHTFISLLDSPWDGKPTLFDNKTEGFILKSMLSDKLTCKS